MRFFKNLYILIFFLFIFSNGWSQSNIPPNLNAIGDQSYCPLSQINIVTSFDIIDPDDTEIQSLSVQISTGYVQGEDQLLLTGVHPNVISSWNTLEGKLLLNGVGGANVSYIDLIAAVNDIVFQSTSATLSEDKFFSFTIGDANYLPSTDHYYEYISDPGITWTQAKAAAEARTYFGLQGYLVTITSAEEAQLSGEQAAGTGWIGGSDAEIEGTWKWVTGPEAGGTFWFGGGNGTIVGADFPYANWNNLNNEPNNAKSGTEHYAHIVSPNLVPLGQANLGTWNDLPNEGSTGNFFPQGYIVEYGGMPGDPIVNIAASTKITIPKVTSLIGGEICGEDSYTINAAVSEGNVVWFDAQTGGNQVHMGSTFTTPILTETTSYYVLASVNGCLEGNRTQVTVRVNTIPTITSVVNTTICGDGSGMLSATASQGTINWYDTLIGGTSLATGNSFATPILTSTTIYYVDATNNGCTTATRTSVTIVVKEIPEFEVEEIDVYCFNGDPIELEVYNPKGNYTYTWIDSNGNVISGVMGTKLEVNSGGIYSVTATSSDNCESFPVSFRVIETNIENADIEIIELSDNNTISIDVTDIGTGDYEFSLDNEFGPFQDTAFFDYVRSGNHILYIRDKNGCGTFNLELFVLGFSKFFTPNGDSINDTWNIKGLSSDYAPNSKVFIFDRYGKLIKEINPRSDGWDGTFNGESLSQSDYWFVAELVNLEGDLRILKGHFTLKR